MKHTLAPLSLLSLIALSSFASDVTKDVKFQVHRDEKWSGDTVKTGKSGAKFEVLKSHTVIELAPNTEVKLALGAEPESIELITGMARAHVQKKIDQTNPKIKFLMSGKVATMGVRGTDFVAISTPILGESEIIVFEGNVDFASAADAKDTKNVPAGHWGGLGGRFGAKTHDLIALPKETLEYFNLASTVK